MHRTTRNTTSPVCCRGSRQGSLPPDCGRSPSRGAASSEAAENSRLRSACASPRPGPHSGSRSPTRSVSFQQTESGRAYSHHRLDASGRTSTVRQQRQQSRSDRCNEGIPAANDASPTPAAEGKIDAPTLRGSHALGARACDHGQPVGRPLLPSGKTPARLWLVKDVSKAELKQCASAHQGPTSRW